MVNKTNALSKLEEIRKKHGVTGAINTTASSTTSSTANSTGNNDATNKLAEIRKKHGVGSTTKTTSVKISDALAANNPAFVYLQKAGGTTGGIKKGSDALVKGTASSTDTDDTEWYKKILRGIDTGLTSAGHAITSAADALGSLGDSEGGPLQELWYMFGGDRISKDNPLRALKNQGDKEVEYRTEKNAAIQDDPFYKYAAMTAESGAMLVPTLMSGGATAAAGTTAALTSAANYAQAGSKAAQLGMLAKNAVSQFASKADAKYIFASTAGASYNEAKQEGADDLRATVYALLNGANTAVSELGGVAELGGLQKLIGKKGEGNLLLNYVMSTGEEILEEIYQGATGRAFKSIYKDVPLYSTTNDDAIFNPNTALDEATGAAVVSTLLGIPTSGINAYYKTKQNNAIKKVYGSDAQSLVSEGLEADEGTTAHTLAQQAQQKLDSGKTLTAKELRELVQANEEAFSAETPAQTIPEYEPAQSNKRTVQTVQSTPFIPYSSTAKASTVQNTLDNSMSGRNNVVNSMARQYAVSPEVIERTYNLNPTAPQAFETAFNAVYQMGQQGADKSALAKVPVLNQTQAQIAYQMGASSARLNNTQEVNSNEVHLRNVAERTGGQNTEGQVRGVAEGAGSNVTRASGSGQSSYSAIQGKAGEQVVYNGAAQKNVYYYTGEETEDMKKGRKLAESYGYKVAYFVGDNIRVQGGTVRGVVDTENKTVMVRADHPDLTPLQIMRHEMGHAAIAKGDFTLAELRQRLLKDFTDAEIDEMVEVYRSAYSGILDAGEAFEEICCDALGKINIFAGTKQNSASYVKAQRNIRKYAAEKNGSKGRAPPETGGVKYSLEGKNKDGVEVYTTSEDVRSLTRKERQKKFLEIMQNEYRGRTAKFVRNGHAYYATFDSRDVNKNIYGDRRSSNSGYNAKLKVGADGNIFELVENSKYDSSKVEQGKDTQSHKQVRYWDYFVKTVQIDNEVFDLLANVRRKSDGDYVYSIQLRANKSIEASAAQQPNQKVGVNKAANASENSIRSSEENVKKYSLEPVKAIQPQSSEWERGSTTDEVRAKHPDLWAVDAESSESRNPTQISGTVKSYRKIYDTLKAEGFDGTVLDASSGLGYGTRAGIEEYGFNVEDIEPFPDSSYKPKYTDYSKLHKKYDVIISNAVLNVLPQDQRDALVVKMGQMLNNGGRMFINVRGTDVRNASSKVAIDEGNMEYYISNTGSYQKGFTKKELVAYLQDALGDGYTVTGTNKFGAVSAVVTKKNTAKTAEKFSMEAPVEQKENLIALHNLDETKLLKTLKLGGFPMPSIAITKSDIPHTNFGNITIVFGKETIDPKLDERNTVYSADAWTPTFPQIEYEASPKTEQKIRDIYYPLSRKYGFDFTRPLYESVNYLGDTLTRYGGEKGLLEKFADDVDMMNVFLAASGKEPIKATDKEIVTRLPDTEVEMYDYLANAIGEETVYDMQMKSGENPISAKRRWVSEHEQDIISAWQGYLTDVVGMSREAAEAETSEMEAKSLTQTFVKVRNYLKNGAETRRTEPDTDAQRKAIRAAVNKTEYKAWLENLYSGAVKNSGVYNNKDVYTSSGNRRSFKALHFPATLDGIVSAMASQNKGSTKNVSGFHGVKTLRAGTAERFGSIEDMHKLEGRLSHLTEEEAGEIHNALSDRLSTQMNEIYNLIPHSGNDYIGLGALGEIYMEAAELKYKSPANVKALFKKYRYNLSDKQANDIVALLFDINNMPVNIFEAKPERAVSFDEIRKVIIPDTSSDELRTALKNAGIENVEEYPAGDDAARMRIANAVPNVHFSREQRKNAKVSKQAWAQIQNRRMLKYGNRFDTMPSMDYIFANDSLFVINNHDEASFTVTRKIDPAKDKVLADKIVEALKNGSIETTRDFDRWAKVLRNNARRGNGDNVHAGNRRAAGGNAQLDDRAERTADRGSIADKGSGDNGVSYSREPETLNELRRQNKVLRERVDYWKRQTKPTKVKQLRMDDIRRLAKEVVSMSETDLKPKDITEDLTELGKYLLNEPELRYTDVSEMAEDIAADVIENATAIVNEEDTAVHNELRDYLKRVKLRDDGSAEFESIRSRYKRRIMFDKNGLGVDTAYAELHDMFGEGYFPEDIVNPADQLERIAEVLDNTAPKYANPNGYYAKEATEFLRNYIIDSMLGEDMRQAAPTYADKAEAKLAAAKAQSAQKLNKQKTEYDEKISNIKAQNEKRIKKAIAEERQRGEKRLQRFRDSVESRDAKRKETAEKNRYKAQIEKNVKTLSDWLLKPDHKNALKHIPGELQSTVRDFIASIDFTSARQLGGGAATAKDMRYLSNLERLHRYITDKNVGEDRYSGYLDLPPNFETELGNFIHEVNALARKNSGYTINDMTVEQLKELSDIVKTMKKTITDMNRMYQNRTFQHAYDAGASDVATLKGYVRTKAFTTNLAANRLDQTVMWEQSRPAHVFRRFGKGGESIYREFADAQSTMAFLTKEVLDFANDAYKSSEVKAWAKETHTFEFGDDTVTLTTAQLMSLYELNKRKQAKQHLDAGGFRVANFKNGRFKLETDKKSHAFTDVELGKMFEKLTDRQKEVADKLQRFMVEKGGEWGNYVSIKRFDVEMFKDENYFPIKVDNGQLDAKETESVDNASLYQLLNMGFAKDVSAKANQALVVYDIFDVFANHMSEMAQYRSFALPVLDAMKWFNYKERNESGVVTASFREEMRRAFGSDVNGRGFAEKFITGVIKAYNGAEGRGENTYASKSLNLMNRQAVAYNTRVMIQQPSAIVRAAMFLDPTDLAASLKNYAGITTKTNIEEMHKYSGVAVWKDLGFYDVNVSRGVRELIKNDQGTISRINEIGMKGAELADKVTWAALWDASKKKVRRETGLNENSEEFYAKVSELFEDVIYNTQVVDTVLTKSEYSRDKRFSRRLFSSFMSEPMTTASLVTSEIFDIQMKQAAGEKLKLSDYSRLSKTCIVVAVAAAVNSALAALADAWRDDDDYGKFGDKWLRAFRIKLADELMPLTYLPYSSTVWDTFKLMLDKMEKKWFGLDVYGNGTDLPISDIIEATTKVVEIFKEIDEKGESSKYTKFGGYYKVVNVISKLTGVPIYNLMREIVTLNNNLRPDSKWKSYEPSAENSVYYAWKDGYLSNDEALDALQDMGDDSLDADKAYLTLEKWKANASSEYFAVYDAIDNDGDIRSAVKDMLDHGKEEGYVKSAITNHYKDAYINGDNAERARIRKALYATGLYGSVNDVIEKCNSWLK